MIEILMLAVKLSLSDAYVCVFFYVEQRAEKAVFALEASKRCGLVVVTYCMFIVVACVGRSQLLFIKKTGQVAPNTSWHIYCR